MEENNVMNNDNIENVTEGKQEEVKKESFFKRHKVGTAVAGVGTLIVTGLAIIGSIAQKKQVDVDDDFEEDDEEIFDDPELEELIDLENGSTEDDSEK